MHELLEKIQSSRDSSEPVWHYWVNAFRPKTLSASLAPIPAGAALAYAQTGIIHWFIPCFTLLSALCIQTAVNLINDALDFKRKADSDDRLGPRRLIQGGIMTSRQVFWMAVGFMILALLFGVPLILKGGYPLLFILLASCLSAYFYTGGPCSMSWKGWADPAVVLFFGVVLTGSVYYLETGRWDRDAVVAGVQIGLLCTIMLAVNNLRDYLSDSKIKKLTLIVRCGKNFGRWEITFLSSFPFLLNFYWLSLGMTYACWLPFLSLPLAVRLTKNIWTHEPSPIYNRFLALGGGLHLLFSLLLAVGFVLA
jgi:1,4-dihydroxy-2-naphthoate polyprenyltransferase